MGKVFKSNALLLLLDPEVAHQKINVELMKNIIIPGQVSRVKNWMSKPCLFSVGIENKCKLNIMTKIYLGTKRQVGSIK